MPLKPTKYTRLKMAQRFVSPIRPNGLLLGMVPLRIFVDARLRRILASKILNGLKTQKGGALGLNIKGGAADPIALATALHHKVSRKNFDKTKFALAVLTENEDEWRVPAYIRDGLIWLKDEVRIEIETALPDTKANVIGVTHE